MMVLAGVQLAVQVYKKGALILKKAHAKSYTLGTKLVEINHIVANTEKNNATLTK